MTSCRRMYHLLILVALYSVRGSNALVDQGHHCTPLELSIHQDSQTLECNFVSLRTTQIHKGLQRKPVIAEYIPLLRSTDHTNIKGSTATQIRLYACPSNKGELFQKAQAICVNELQLTRDSNSAGGNQHLLGLRNAGHPSILSWSPEMVDHRPLPLEVRPLFISGPSSNRVDLVFFADGYVQGEKEKFFQDAHRLAQDMSQNQTFATTSPLLNFWAAFTPSIESGIGVGGHPKNTAFGLYRDGTELRGVYSSRHRVARATALSLGDQCDYPILLGNDPLYGGLGGEFTISTVSQSNGPLVLRHELGHSIIQVGEEYDGGFAYFGPNSQHAIKHNSIKWAHWLSPLEFEPSKLPNRHHSPKRGINLQSYRIERSDMPLQCYAWTMLNSSTSPYIVHFTSSGAYSRSVIQFSLSGISKSSDLRVFLDDTRDLGFVPRADIGEDRWFYEIPNDIPLAKGQHTLSFEIGESADQQVAQLCSIEVLEYGNEDEFNTHANAVSLYPTYSIDGKTTYRPTNDACLMRRVVSPNFCPVCIEGLWLELLKRIDLIDSVKISGDNPVIQEDIPAGFTPKNITLELVPLGYLRAAQTLSPRFNNPSHEQWTIQWKRDGQTIAGFTNMTSVKAILPGVYEIDVQLFSKEVRKDPDNYLRSRLSVILYADGSYFMG